MVDLFISPFKALQQIAAKQLCGHLHVSDPKDSSVGWNIYVGGKRLHYATTSIGHLERMSCLWRQYEITCTAISKETGNRGHGSNLEQMIMEALRPTANLNGEAELLSDNKNPEYSSLNLWRQSSNLPLADFKQLIVKVSTEALIQALSFNKAKVKFFPHSYIDPLIVAVPIANLLKPSLPTIRQWQQLRPYISSPLARVYLDLASAREKCKAQPNITRTPVVEAICNATQYPNWVQLLSQKACLYEVARAAEVDPLTMANWLHPLLEAKLLEVLPFKGSTSQWALSTEVSVPKPALTIACIDDSSSVQRQVKMVLEMSGYNILSITDPASSLTALVRHKPALILMDINMPDIDGYELSKMLRQTRQLRSVPIVMLTGRSGIIDRMRSQLVGASNFLTKPVEPHQLLEVIEKLAKVPEGDEAIA